MHPQGSQVRWVVLAGALAALPWLPARGDEGGTPFWLSGQYASLAAVPPSPGWSLSAMLYGYSGSAAAAEALPRGAALATGLSSREPLLMLQPTYAPEARVLGGQPSFGIGFGYGRNTTQADLSVSLRGIELTRSDTVWGWTDVSPIADLAWSRGVHNWMAYLTGNIPVGAYDSNRLSNIGIGHAALDAGGGYTYLDQATGREFSAVAGLTYNFENPSTDYRNGIDSHLDWGASLFLSASWELGLAGYVYYQLTGDSGSGARLGPFKSRIAAIGPQLGYTFSVGGQQWYANLRGYYEFWARNRIEGGALFLTLNVPLGAPAK